MSDRFRARRLTLRDGRAVRLRRVKLGDAGELIGLERALAEDGRGVVWDRDQVPIDVAEMRSRMRKWTALPLSMGVMLVAEADGALAGEAKIRRHRPSKVRHVAHLSLGVHPAYQGVGLGRSLMEALLAWARWTATRDETDPGVNRISLDVFEENVRARRLYESMGFRVEGVRRRLLRESDGREHDDLAMALLLDESGEGPG